MNLAGWRAGCLQELVLLLAAGLSEHRLSIGWNLCGNDALCHDRPRTADRGLNRRGRFPHLTRYRFGPAFYPVPVAALLRAHQHLRWSSEN